MNDIILTDSTPQETAYWHKKWIVRKDYSSYYMVINGLDNSTYFETKNCVVSNEEYKKLSEDTRTEFSPLTKSQFDLIVKSTSLCTPHYTDQNKYGDRIIGTWTWKVKLKQN